MRLIRINRSAAQLDRGLLPEGVQMRKPDIALGFSSRDKTYQEAYALFQNARPEIRTSPYTDASFSRMIFPVSIEIGGLDKSNAHANLQIAAWAAASLQKFENLGNAVLSELSADNVPPLVVFIGIARSWTVHIAYRNKGDQASVSLL